MVARCLASIVAAVTLILGLSVPVLAQDGGAAVTIHLVTCKATGTANSIHISASDTPPDALRDCREGWSEETESLAIDGIAPNAISDTIAIWQFVEDGDHIATAPIGGELEFTVAGDPVELWAYYIQHEVPIDDEPGEDPGDGHNTSEDGHDDVSDLPRTGIGPDRESGTTLILIASGLVAASLISMAGSRAARQQ